MRCKAILTAALSVTLVLPLVQRAALAEVGASGSRLAIAGGQPRFYMTYGHIEEPELYAPIVGELGRAQVSAERHGEDYWIYQKGVKVAEWPIVRSREEVPETGEQPCVLVMGGNVFMPVRKLSELCGFDVKWDRKSNLVTLVPDANKKPVALVPHPTQDSARVIEVAPATLSGVTLEETAGGVRVHVKSNFPVRPVWSTVHSPAPVRLVVDFPNAHWADNVQLPNGTGSVSSLKIGHPNGSTARLVMVVPSAAVKLTGLQVTQGEIIASVGVGREVAKLDIPADILKAVTARAHPLLVKNGSRGDLPPAEGGSLLPPITRPSLTLPSLSATALAGKVVCLDAGHGGHSAGALGLDNQEKDLTLKMTQQFQRALEACGATVVMTRSNDDYVSLEDRCQIATSRNVDIFISIHCNSTPRRNSASGSETYFTTPQSLPLAQAMHHRLVGAVHKRDGGIRTCRFYVCRNVAMPSVLLEIAYINNAEDERLMATPEFRNDLAQSLCAGVVEYFNGK